MRQEQIRSEQNLASLPARTSGRESEAPYWVFNTEPAPDDALQPAVEYSAVGAETAGEHRQGQAGLWHSAQRSGIHRHGQVQTSGWQPGFSVTIGPTDTPAGHTSRRPAPATSLPPAAPAVAPGNQTPSQAPINGSVLENDIAAYRRVTEINPRNDRAWDAWGTCTKPPACTGRRSQLSNRRLRLPRAGKPIISISGSLWPIKRTYDKAIQALQNALH